jgi:hypothetical protein
LLEFSLLFAKKTGIISPFFRFNTPEQLAGNPQEFYSMEALEGKKERDSSRGRVPFPARSSGFSFT